MVFVCYGEVVVLLYPSISFQCLVSHFLFFSYFLFCFFVSCLLGGEGGGDVIRRGWTGAPPPPLSP